MKTQLTLAIETAIEKIIDDNAEDDLWEGYIDPHLAHRMALAAELVFDSAMEAQAFAKEQ